LGAAARPAVPELLKLLFDADRYVRWEAGIALVGLKVGPEILFPPIRELAAHEDSHHRVLAADILRLLGPQAAPALADLLRLLADKTAEVRREAALSLKELGPAARAAAPLLRAALADPDPGVRKQAERTLKVIES
jgi:HEAT repeat protein